MPVARISAAPRIRNKVEPDEVDEADEADEVDEVDEVDVAAKAGIVVAQLLGRQHMLRVFVLL